MSLVLAHAGPGSTWQAMVVAAAVVLAAVVALAGTGRVRVERPADLLLPATVAALAAALATVAHDWLSDAVGWALPVGIVAAGALAVAASTPLQLRFPAPLAMAAVALAVVGAVVLGPRLAAALHPPAELLPISDDAVVVIVEPRDGDVVQVGSDGTIEMVVEVAGGSVGPGDVPVDDLPADPEEAGALAVARAVLRPDGTTTPAERLPTRLVDPCTLDAPCTTARLRLPLDAGAWRLTVEFTRGDGTPLAPFVRDRIEVEVLAPDHDP